MAIDLAKKKVSSEKVASFAEKVLLAANLAHCNIMVFCLLTAQEEATSADTFDLVDSGCW